MQNPSPTARRSGLGRALRSAAALLAGVLVTTCADNPTAPNRPGFGSIRVQPAYDQYASLAPLVLNQVRAIVVRPPSDTVVDTVRAFNVNDQALSLSLRLTLQATEETMDVSLLLLSNGTTLFRGTQAVTVRQGGNAPSTSIPVTYEGPGANAESLELAPRDSLIRVGSTLQMRATALDGEGVDVGQFYLNWSLVGAAQGATIDATGLLHAPTSAGTVMVRGITPTGLRDSVELTVVPAPATLAKNAGDNQTADPSTRLALPLVVLVTGTGGVPVPGVTVAFAATTGGGQVDSATATTDANGLARSGVTLGATAGAQTFTVSSTGLTAVVFTATAQAPGPQTRTWSGAVSTDWSVPGNWVGGTAPGSNEAAIIGAATRQPSLSATTVVGNLTINSGGILTVNGQTILVSGDFTTAGTGIIKMTGGSDGVGITNNAVFGGGDETGFLTAGALQVGGNFTQLSGTSPNSYRSTGSHTTAFTGAAPTVTFASVTGTNSSFQNVSWSTAGASSTMTLGSPIFVHGIFSVGGVGAAGLTSTSGARLTVLGDFAPVLPLVLNNVPLTIDQATTGSTIFVNAGLTFQNMATNVSQLVIRHPGQSAPIVLPGLTFSTVPVAPNGFYLDVTDNTADANVLTVNLTGAAPASGGAFVKTGGGAIVNWPPSSGVSTWTGAVSTDWSNAANWSQGTVPTGASAVTIGAATNQPTLSEDVSVGSVVVSTAGARLTLGGHSLAVVGDFTTHTDGLLVSTNPADKLLVSGDAAFQGGDETGLISAGEMRLFGGFTQQVQTSPNSFYATGSHRTIFVNTSVLQDVHFCCTANTSRFMNLDISNSFGINIQFAGNGVFVADTFIVQPGAGPRPWLYMLGSPMTAKRFKINRLLVDRGTLTLNEGGVAGAEQFDSVTFQNYLATQTQLAVVAPGTRTLTFTNLVFQTLAAGNTGRYVNATASTGTLTLDLTTANVANGPAFTTINGNAIVNWPGSTPVNTWTGAASTAWTNAANWNLGRIPAVTDSVVIPNAVTNFPTLTGRQTVGAMFEDGRLTINGGTLVVTRGTSSNAGINRIISLTQPNDSLIIGGDVASPISSTAGTIVIRGTVTTPFSLAGARLVLDGTTAQGIAGSGSIPIGILVIDKVSSTVTFNSGQFAIDSVDVVSGTFASSVPIAVTKGFSQRAGSSLLISNSLTLSSTISALGTYNVQTTIFKLPDVTSPPVQIPVLSYTNLQVANGGVSGSAVLTARTVLSGSLSVFASGSNATLNLNGHAIVVGGDVSTGGISQAAIGMSIAADSVIVAGNAAFSTGIAGTMTGGTVVVGGTFTQTSPFGAPSYAPTGTQKTVLTAFNPTISMDGTGIATNQSRFNDLTWTGGGTLTLTANTDSMIVITGVFTTTNAGTTTIQGSGVNRQVRFASLAATGADLFTNVRVIVSQPTVPFPGTPIGLSNVTFQNQDPTKAQLTIEHPGLAAGLTLNNLTFTGAPTSGFYISATDDNPSDGVPLVVNVTNSSPATGPAPFIQQVNGAQVHWPPVAPVNTWTGGVSTAWETPGNWSSGAVPTASTDAIVPSGTPFAPTAGTIASNVKSLTVNPGATLTLISPNGLTAAGNVNADGAITGSGNLAMTAVATLQGNVGTLNLSNIITLSGPVTSGPVTVTGAAAELLLNGFTFVGSGWAFQNGARLGMTNPNDSLVATGSMTFAGGSTLGRLTAGAIELRGGLAQVLTGSTTSFASTGTRVWATGGSIVTYTFQSPGPSLSRFANLIVNKTGGTVNLLSRVNADIVTIDAGLLSLNGQALTTTAGFVVQNTGLLQMTNANDSLLVGGNAFFTGTGNETGQMTAGVLRVGQNLTQSGGNTNLVATGTHKTVFTNGLTSTITFATVGATGNRFQNVDITGNAAVNIAGDMFVSGAMTVSGNPSINANALTVRGLLTTSPGSGLGLNDLTLGNATSVAAGSGFINARRFILDGTGAQTMPVIPAPSGPDSAQIIVRSQTAFTAPLTLNGLRVEGNGQLDMNGQAVNVVGDFVTANNGTLTMLNPADRLTITGATTFGGGSEDQKLGDGILTTSGRFTQDGTNSTLSFGAFGNHVTRMATAYPGGNVVTIGSPTSTAFMNLQLSVPVTFASDIVVFNNFTLDAASATPIPALRFVVQGTYAHTSPAAFSPRKFVMYGPAMNVTAGAFTPDTLEFRDNVITLPVNPRITYQTVLANFASAVTAAPGHNTFVNLAVNDNATFIFNSAGLLVNGTMGTSGSGKIQMTHAIDSLVVTGVATFAGGSTDGLMTAGVTTFANDFIQNAATSTTSFAPSGTHKTRFITGALRQLSFGSPGTGSGGSHFQDLDLANATSGVNLTVNSIVQGTLSSTGSGKLVSSGQSLTVRQVNLNGFISTGAPLIINEQGTALTQSVNNVSFTGFGGGGNNVLTYIAAGAAGPRTLTFTALNFNALGIGAANHYVNLSSSNGQPITLNIQGSNQQATGPGFTQTDGVTSIVNWQP